ncbi:PilZ domain-containing protein [Thiotrichales bacterium 19S3-7]|nr:PilZ domain-containing protein [Thiotrichales bacterium 19S3-7]MCF6801961.1 PilZ domain-containing protein [Thiotrichales bacterium 19S3-11]
MALNRITFEDKLSAYKAMMPFIAENAIFVATSANGYRLGEQIQITVNLSELGQSLSFRGSIVWLSYETSTTEEGIGVRFEGIEGKKVKKVLESYTSEISGDQSTSTL